MTATEKRERCLQVGPLLIYRTSGELTGDDFGVMLELLEDRANSPLAPFALVAPIELEGHLAFLLIVDTKQVVRVLTKNKLGKRFVFYWYRFGLQNGPNASPLTALKRFLEEKRPKLQFQCYVNSVSHDISCCLLSLLNVVIYFSASIRFLRKIQQEQYKLAGEALKIRLSDEAWTAWFDKVTGPGMKAALAQDPHWQNEYREAAAGWFPGIPASTHPDILFALCRAIPSNFTPAHCREVFQYWLANFTNADPVPERGEAEKVRDDLCKRISVWLDEENNYLWSLEPEQVEAQAAAAKDLAGRILLYLDARFFERLTLKEKKQRIRMTVLDVRDKLQYMCFLNDCIVLAREMHEQACMAGDTAVAESLWSWLDVFYICRHCEYHGRYFSGIHPFSSCEVCLHIINANKVGDLFEEEAAGETAAERERAQQAVFAATKRRVYSLFASFRRSNRQGVGWVAFNEALSGVRFGDEESRIAIWEKPLPLVKPGQALVIEVTSVQVEPVSTFALID